jgi:signal transduction histidine kinase
VENAIKYTAGVGSRVRLEAGAEGTDGTVCAWVRVADDGPGIAPEHLPHLCDRFYRVDVARSRNGEAGAPADGGSEDDGDGGPDGTGLGLSIVEWVARAHGGELHIRSTVGAGSVFELRLPLDARPTAAVAAGSEDGADSTRRA